MELRVLSGISTTDSDRILSLADQIRIDWAAAGQETAQLDQGLAVFSKDFPDIPEVNHLFFARVPSGQDFDKWFESAVHFYQKRSACLCGITPARSAPVSERDALTRLLLERGWNQVQLDILRLDHAIRLDPPHYPIVSARAVVQLYESFAHGLFRTQNPRRADVSIRKLDDPRYDVLVMIQERQIVARAGLMTSGEVGLIQEVYSADQHQDGLLRKAIMGAVIDLCIRAQLRHVFTVVDPKNSLTNDFYTSLGFSRIGSETSFVLSDPDKALYKD